MHETKETPNAHTSVPLPCPWCGETPNAQEGHTFTVYCANDDCGMTGVYAEAYSLAEAEAIWNKRAAAPAVSSAATRGYTALAESLQEAKELLAKAEQDTPDYDYHLGRCHGLGHAMRRMREAGEAV